MFAILESGGKQYKVQEGDLIKIEKLESEDNSQVVIDKVLLISDGEKVTCGNPYIQEAKVEATKIKDDKNKKLIIYKYKRRKDFDKKIGHRQKMSILKIDKISI